MKTSTIIFVFLAMAIGNAVNGQNRKPSNTAIIPLKHPEYNKAVKVLPPLTGNETVPLRQSLPLPSVHTKVSSATGIVTTIGQTTYDLQSNGSALNTIYHDGSHIGAVFIRSISYDLASPDRRTGYNFSDDTGATWSGVDSIETDRRGWGNLDMLGAGECLVSHKMNDSLGFYYRPVQGTGVWTHTGLTPPAGNFSLWPRMVTGGAAGNSVHIIAITTPVANGGTFFNGLDGALTYTRSQDGGATWNINNILLPDIDSLHYTGMRGDNYVIDASGNTIAIVFSGLTNDWVLWKSVDDGSTWTKKVIKPFQVSPLDLATTGTDINGDGVGDTLETTDGAVEVLVDNNGMVHSWAGRMYVIQDSSTANLAYFPTTDGLLYWNESFANYFPTVIASAVDIDSSGTIDLAVDIGGSYQRSLTSMPAAGIDAAGNIYVAYSGIVELTTNGGTPEQSYRNIYSLVSPDNGFSWSIPVNLINDNFAEGVFPSVARDVDAHLHLTWMQDAEPGLAVNGDMDPFSLNDIVYDLEDTSGLFTGIHPVPPVYFQNYLTGNVFYDLNQNGLKDGSDYGMSHQKLLLLPDSIFTFTNPAGNYTLTLDSGYYTVKYVPELNWQLTSDSASFTVLSDTSMVFTGMDFGAYPVSQVYDLTSFLTGSMARCNSDVNYWVTYENTGTAIIDSGTITFVKDPLMTFVQSTPPYNIASGDTFIWNFTNLFPFQQGQINIVLHIGPPLNQGDTIHNCETVNYDDGITARTSNDCLTQVVVCSFDPNDKSVRPEGVGPQHFTLLADTLQYAIRFQNTGTDTAFVVRIKDTLDVSLDVNSFHVLASSHPVLTTIQNNGAIEWLFDDILLPDSNVNELASHGFVKYSVKAKPGTPDFTAVENTAYIYFDYNPPVVTNTTTNTLVTALSVPEISFYNNHVKIYPNPFSETTQIIFENPGREKFTMKIFDVTGRELRSIKDIITDKIIINKENLSHGIYFIELKNESNNVSAKGKMIVK